MPRLGSRVSPRTRPLTGDDVERLPGACASCVFWELGATCPSPRTTAIPGWIRTPTPSSPAIRKQAWVSARVQEGAPPGCLVEVDDEVVAYALFARADAFVIRGTTVPRPSDDALLLATLWVRPTEREAGVGKLLIRSALREAQRQGAGAVEAYGDRRYLDRSCILPSSWLLHEGFTVHREHPRTPLLRLDLRRTARWTESLEQAWEEVLGRLPHPAPARQPVRPAIDVHRSRSD